MNLDYPVVMFSIDFEMGWGKRHRKFEGVEPSRLNSRPIVLALLELFSKYDIKATWATVGHLFLNSCEMQDAIAHPEIVRPDYEWLDEDWFALDPCRDWSESSVWYAPDMVDRIANSKPNHEIGSHSFSHMFVTKGFSRETMKSEIDSTLRAAALKGHVLESHVFPLNNIGFIDVLSDYGFLCYRGKLPIPHRNLSQKIYGRIKRSILGSDYQPAEVKRRNGIWDIPHNFWAGGFGNDSNFATRSRRVFSWKNSLKQVARNNGLLHGYLHPHDFLERPESSLKGFEELLKSSAQLIELGKLRNLTMAEFAREMNDKSPAAAL